MERYWLFNAYGKDVEGNTTDPRWPWLVSIRLHKINVPDVDRDKHDHPWNARTVILRGYYGEVRELTVQANFPNDGRLILRRPGDTAALKYGEYHKIVEVSEGGVWTLFITGRYRGVWGFKVNGVKVPWREYLAARQDKGCALPASEGENNRGVVTQHSGACLSVGGGPSDDDCICGAHEANQRRVENKS